MKSQVTLDNKELRIIVAKALGIREEQVTSLKYNVAIEGLSAEEIERRIKALE